MPVPNTQHAAAYINLQLKWKNMNCSLKLNYRGTALKITSGSKKHVFMVKHRAISQLQAVRPVIAEI
jgi:hypothetical protein